MPRQSPKFKILDCKHCLCRGKICPYLPLNCEAGVGASSGNIVGQLRRLVYTCAVRAQAMCTLANLTTLTILSKNQ